MDMEPKRLAPFVAGGNHKAVKPMAVSSGIFSEIKFHHSNSFPASLGQSQ